MIRNATQQDLPAILAIMNDAIENTTTIYDYKTRDEDYIIQWFTNKTKDNWPVLIYEVEGKTVAYGSYGTFRAWEAFKVTVEHSIYVEQKYRGKGIGKQLLHKLIETAKQQGYHTMIGGIDATNNTSICLHKQFGFVEAGRIKETGFKFDKWLDLVFMQLIL